MSDPDFGYGYREPSDSASDFAAQQFLVAQMLARVRTAVLVKVTAETGGGVNPPGTVNVQPLVSMIDGAGNTTPHGTIFNIPVLRLQSGIGAIIADPQPDDIGIMLVCDRDISSAKTTGEVGPPGSRRRFDLADGIYLGGILGATPTRYISLNADGITVIDGNGNTVTLAAAGIDITDSHGNEYETTATGTTISDNNGNIIQMRAGFVNVITAVFQVNGVPVTVP